MGSFAANLHVKTADADQVAAALQDILVADAWRPAESASPENRRGIQVSAAAGGWVSVLDSDLAGSHAVAPRLAARLGCPAIFCYVNDSDSFGYLVADSRGNTSEFDSEDVQPEEFDADAVGGDLVNAAAAIGNFNALLGNHSFLQKMQDFQARLSSAAPADIREAEERLKTGRGTPSDMQSYQAWAMEEMPKHLEQMKAMLGAVMQPSGALPGPAAATTKPRTRSRSERAAWKKRLAALRPLLAPGVSDEDVEEVCQRQAVFAEEVLADFLRLLGITDFYAHLSYDYLDEAGPEELAAYKIRFVHHLRFEGN